MATVDEMVEGIDTALEGIDPDAMVAVLAPGATIWHDYDRKVVDARENMAAIGTLSQIVRDAKMERIRVGEFDGGFVYQYALHGTVISTGKPFEMQNCIVASIAGGLITRIDEYVDPTVGAQLGLTVRIGVFFPTKEHRPLDEMVEQVRALAASGFSSAWLPQSTGFDALTALAVIGAAVDRIELGTSVVPTYPRHPVMLAAQALTADAATGGRLVLGIGLSHRMAVERTYALSYDRPARHMREYLSILLPLLRDRAVDYAGETLTGRAQLTIADPHSPPVLLAALQPRMLDLAGGFADGTVTWCTGPVTLEEQIVPLVAKAAAGAGRPTPRVVVPLPTIVTNDEADGRVKAGEQLAGYGQIPVYRAVLDREGADGPADVSIVGDEVSVTAQLRRLDGIGATDFVAIPCGDPEDRRRTLDHLATLAA